MANRATVAASSGLPKRQRHAAGVLNSPGRSLPPPAVLAAYGLEGAPVPLTGGRNTTWRVDQAVVKPLDMEPSLVQWQGALLARLRGRTDFRVSVPLRTTDGNWTANGWTAWRYEPGAHVPRRWHDIVAVGQRLHTALELEPEPAFLRARVDKWAIGDKVAWGELPAADYAGTRHLATLSEALRPLDLRRQLVHGDLTGNVLFHPGLSPLVIDLSAYWRPPAFASAVVIADALLFEGAGEEVVEPLLQDPAFPQCLLRALIYRAVTDHLARPGLRREDAEDPYRPVVEMAARLALSA